MILLCVSLLPLRFVAAAYRSLPICLLLLLHTAPLALLLFLPPYSAQATTGIVADARQLVRQACEDCKDYRRQYAHSVPTRVLAERLGGYVHAYTLYSYLRPFAVATLIAGHDDEDQYQLRVVEPSGVTLGYYASAVGKGAAAAKTELEKLKFAEFTCQQAVSEIARMCVLRTHTHTHTHTQLSAYV